VEYPKVVIIGYFPAMSRRAHLAVVVALAILTLSISLFELAAGERLSWGLLVAAVISVSVYGTDYLRNRRREPSPAASPGGVGAAGHADDHDHQH